MAQQLQTFFKFLYHNQKINLEQTFLVLTINDYFQIDVSIHLRNEVLLIFNCVKQVPTRHKLNNIFRFKI